jgi:hypothetical protein
MLSKALLSNIGGILMETSVVFLPTIEKFNNIAIPMIESKEYKEILISGIWNKAAYEEVLKTIIKNGSAHKCNILVPNMKLDKVLPVALINQINKQKGQVKINGQFNNNLLIIDKNVFILSFSFKYSKDNTIKIYFECGMFISQSDIADEVRDNFKAMWNKGLCLVTD